MEISFRPLNFLLYCVAVRFEDGYHRLRIGVRLFGWQREIEARYQNLNVLAEVEMETRKFEANLR